MRQTLFALALLLAACTAPPEETVQIPTLAVLPTLTPSDTPTLTPVASPTQTATATPTPTRTPIPTSTPTLTLTVTPSTTITDTPTSTPTRLPTNTPPNAGLGVLALTALGATVRPSVAAPSPTFFITPPAGGTFTPLPGIPTPTQLVATPNCPTALPTALSNFLNTDPTFRSGLGCPVGTSISVGGAAQAFERGSMVYVAGTPGNIYTLTNDGRFRRFFDTWIDGVDPASGGAAPPPGLIEPIRGFGKVWRSNSDVSTGLGWAITSEQGGTLVVQYFDRGRALYLPERGETVILVDNPDGLSGTWRAFSGGF